MLLFFLKKAFEYITITIVGTSSLNIEKETMFTI